LAFVQRCIARGAVERDARLNAIKDEGIALDPSDADVGLGVDVEQIWSARRDDCQPIICPLN
jgi:hypothetical protein